ncbi:hypothetical protein RFI_39054 [Reticulomyxa filosa]|uniref:Kelch motif family protein n=1 Tax=Reticulomyxa filosa TaxID=46433 RepID=X6LBF1_RETFI|nr:hypothetical protein RFI_39054 [Reticulomyxa filosa]|eukprot:ETN98446.1 hypothetical protein RFI_39054 [Reticulomyxa filosa]
MKTNQEKIKQNFEMLLFCYHTGLSIEYDEDNNTFKFYQLPVCNDMKPFYQYAYVYVNDITLFFGGSNYPTISKSVHKYSIRKNKWMTFQNILPSPLRDCVAILSEDNTYVYIIGGENGNNMPMSIHMKTEVSEWLSEEEMKKGIQLKVEEEDEDEEENEENEEEEEEEEKESNSEMNKIVKKKNVKAKY